MSLSPTSIAFIQLHISICLAGFTAVLGKLISMNAIFLVWYRMLLTVILLGFFLLLKKKLERISIYAFCKIGGVGLLLCLHWLFFYGSIKVSNVSIAVVSFSLVGFFTAIFEPFFMHQRFSWREMVYSLFPIIGVGLIFSFDTRYRMGIILGTIAALLCAFFMIGNKYISKDYSASSLLLYQMVGGTLALSCFMPLYVYATDFVYISPTVEDWLWLLCLVTVCTIGMNLLLIEALRSISAFTVNLSYNLEPIYSIILAIIFLGEAQELNFTFYVGLSFILFSVGVQSLWVAQQGHIYTTKNK